MGLINLIIGVIMGILVYLFNGCFEPPPPVTITTPKSTSREIHVNWENHLVITLDKNNYEVKYGKNTYISHDSLSLDRYFTKNYNELNKYRDSIAIKEKGASFKHFSIIISVLKNHNFQKYQLLIDKAVKGKKTDKKK
jgi:hypothetical protein